MAGAGDRAPSTNIRNLNPNLEALDGIINSDAPTIIARETPDNPAGKVIRTIAGAQADIDNLIANGQSAIASVVSDGNATIAEIEELAQVAVDGVGYDYLDPLTFETGATITNANQALLWAAADGGNDSYYRWAGALPKTVPSGSTPADSGGVATGAWRFLGDAALRSELADPNKGAAMLARGVVAVDSIADLLALPEGQRRGDLRYLVKGYHAGSDVGGGEFYWDASKPRSQHNGGTIIDPTAVYPTDWDDQTQLGTWFDTSNNGTGCWVRQFDGAVNVKWFGAKGDTNASTTVGHANYANPAGTDDWYSFQRAIDFATSINSSIYIPESSLWYKIHKDQLTVTCSVKGAGRESSKLKFTDDEQGIRLSFVIESVKNGNFEDFSYDCSVSADPVDWDNNFDNFTGRRGLLATQYGERLVFKNINATNTFQAGIGFYGGSDTFIVDNVSVIRCRGNYGDGLYFSGTSKKAKITNCTVYDFTRIGCVFDSPDGGIIEDCVVENCLFEYGHNPSASHGGGEFNSGIWLEQTARSIIKNCTAKNTNGRGFTVTTGGRALEIAGYTECYSVIDSCIAEDTGAGYLCESLEGIPSNHRVVNCTAINCEAEDVGGIVYGDGTNNVFISNFYSEKSFSPPQARCLNFGNETANGVTNVVVNGFKVKSDFDKDTFDFVNRTSGHIGTFSNSGELNYTITNFYDSNGIAVNNKHGLSTGKWVFNNCDNLLLNSLRAGQLFVEKCTIDLFLANASPQDKLHVSHCTINSTTVVVTNTDIVFDNCTFNVPDDGKVHISNTYADLDEPKKVICKITNCYFYKDYQGAEPYALQFSTKNDPNKVGLLLDNCFFYNTNVVGTGGYPVWFNNGVAHFLGESYLDDTVQYFYMSYSTPQTSSPNIIKLAFQ